MNARSLQPPAAAASSLGGGLSPLRLAPRRRLGVGSVADKRAGGGAGARGRAFGGRDVALALGRRARARGPGCAALAARGAVADTADLVARSAPATRSRRVAVAASRAIAGGSVPLGGWLGASSLASSP